MYLCIYVYIYVYICTFYEEEGYYAKDEQNHKLSSCHKYFQISCIWKVIKTNVRCHFLVKITSFFHYFMMKIKITLYYIDYY